MGIDVLGVDSGVVYRAHTRSVLIIVESGEPGGQALDGCFEVGVLVNKGAKLFGQPLETDLFLASARGQLLDAAIREIHVCILPYLRRLVPLHTPWSAGFVAVGTRPNLGTVSAAPGQT